MGKRYVRGLISEITGAIYKVNAANFFEIRENEFLRIYYALGLYRAYSQCGDKSFLEFAEVREYNNVRKTSPEIYWSTIRKGIQFARDCILKTRAGSSAALCSGVMLKNLAYKRIGAPIVMPCNANVLVEKILEFVCHSIPNPEIQKYFLDFIVFDVLQNANADDSSKLTEYNCRDSLLTFQIQMLRNKPENCKKAKDLLKLLAQIRAYQYILKPEL